MQTCISTQDGSYSLRLETKQEWMITVIHLLCNRKLALESQQSNFKGELVNNCFAGQIWRVRRVSRWSESNRNVIHWENKRSLSFRRVSQRVFLRFWSESASAALFFKLTQWQSNVRRQLTVIYPEWHTASSHDMLMHRNQIKPDTLIDLGTYNWEMQGQALFSATLT